MNAKPSSTVIVRNVDPAVKAALRLRAARNGRSMEAETREVLKAAVTAEMEPEEDLGTAIRRLFAPLGGFEMPPRDRTPMRDRPTSASDRARYERAVRVDAPRAASARPGLDGRATPQRDLHDRGKRGGNPVRHRAAAAWPTRKVRTSIFIYRDCAIGSKRRGLKGGFTCLPPRLNLLK